MPLVWAQTPAGRVPPPRTATAPSGRMRMLTPSFIVMRLSPASAVATAASTVATSWAANFAYCFMACLSDGLSVVDGSGQSYWVPHDVPVLEVGLQEGLQVAVLVKIGVDELVAGG